MRVISYIQFDDNEREQFDRALGGYDHAISEPPRRKGGDGFLPVRAIRNRIVEHDEPLNAEALSELLRVMGLLAARWGGETSPEFWRAIAPPISGDDAIDGLAQERRNAIKRVLDCRDIVL